MMDTNSVRELVKNTTLTNGYKLVITVDNPRFNNIQVSLLDSSGAWCWHGWNFEPNFEYYLETVIANKRA